MYFSSSIKLLNLRKTLTLSYQYYIPKCGAKKESAAVSMLGGALKKKKLGKLGPMVEKKVLPVETDANKLVNYVCGSNIFKTGEDVKIKEDGEYPEWLWSIRTGPPLPLDQLDPTTKAYWKRVRAMAMRRNNKLAQLKKF